MQKMASENPSTVLMHFPRDIPCDTCQRGSTANWACRECVQNLCDTCKDSHKMISFTRSHKITSLFERLEHEPGRNNMCSQHGEPIVLFCKTCNLEICLKCQTKVHSGHKVEEIADHARLVRTEIQKAFDDKTAMIKSAEKRLKLLKNAMEDYHGKSHSSIEDVKAELEKIFKDFRKDARICVAGLQSKYEKNESSMTTKCEELETTIKQVEMEINENLAKFRRHPDVGLDRFWKEQLKSKLDGIHIDLEDDFHSPAHIYSCDIVPYTDTIRKAMSNMLKVITGETTSVKERGGSGRRRQEHSSQCVKYSFSYASDVRVFSLAVVRNREGGSVWLGLSHNSEFRVELLNMNGEMQRGKSLNFPPLHIVSSTSRKADSDTTDPPVDDLLIASEVHAPTVRVLKANGHIADFKDTTPYFPYGMCVTIDDHIIVCLQKAGFPGKIVELSTDGRTLREIYIQQYTPTQVVKIIPGLVVKNESLLVHILPKEQRIVPVCPDYEVLCITSDDKGHIFGGCSLNTSRKESLCLINLDGTHKHLRDISFDGLFGKLCNIAYDAPNKLIWVCSTEGSVYALCVDDVLLNQ